MFGLTIISKIKKNLLLIIGALAIVLVGGYNLKGDVIPINEGEKPELTTVKMWQNNKPKNDTEWAEDVKKESFNVKHDYQLDQMQQDLTEKLPKVQADLDKFNNCPECIKWELNQRFSQMFKDQNVKLNGKLEGKTLQQWIDGDFKDQFEYYQWKTGKIEQSLERLSKEKELRASKKVDRTDEILGTIYYIDAINGKDANTGLATSAITAWAHLDVFTEAARAAGDRVVIRRNCTAASSTFDGTDLNFTSDGILPYPIVIEADYDNVWGDFVSNGITGNVGALATSVEVTATTTGIGAGKWVYNSVDNPREYAYEIESVSSGGNINFYIPFKGTVGAGQTFVVMPPNPQWGQAAGDFQWNFDTDNYWKVQGIDIRGTDANGQVEIDSAQGHQFIDDIFTGNLATCYGIYLTDDFVSLDVKKSRSINQSIGLIYNTLADTYGKITIYDIYIDSTNPYGYLLGSGTGWDSFFNVYVYNMFTQSSNKSFVSEGTVIGRNISGSTTMVSIGINNEITYLKIEDFYNKTTYNHQTLGLASLSSNDPQVLSTSTTVRSGGGATSLELRPTKNMSPVYVNASSTGWDFSRVQLFEYPIYADTSNKNYSMYFWFASSTFGKDPLTTELWIECEYYGTTTGANRRLTKSTTVLDASSTDWQAITVTCQPAQNGVLYLRGFYAKTVESIPGAYKGWATNTVLMDVKPVVTTP